MPLSHILSQFDRKNEGLRLRFRPPRRVGNQFSRARNLEFLADAGAMYFDVFGVKCSSSAICFMVFAVVDELKHVKLKCRAARARNRLLKIGRKERLRRITGRISNRH
jgi:hypothetical protein